TADPNSPKDANGLPTGYIQGANFGKAVQDNQFPQPIPATNGGRLIRFAFGFRFLRIPSQPAGPAACRPSPPAPSPRISASRSWVDPQSSAGYSRGCT